MKPLNLSDALELHGILGKHLPENVDLEPLEFIGTIIKNIRQSGEHFDYIDAVSLMTKESIDDLVQKEPVEVLGLFTKGLEMNSIVSLKAFWDRVGLKNG